MGRKSVVGPECDVGPSRVGSADSEGNGPREGTEWQVENTMLGPAGPGKEGEKFLGLEKLGSFEAEGVDRCKPDATPLEGFQWIFLADQWILMPFLMPLEVDKGVEGNEHVSESADLDEEYGSDDSVTDFERSLKNMLPGLKVGNSSTAAASALGTRKSER